MKQFKLAIIIPTKDRPFKLDDVLYTLSLQNYKSKKIIVVDSSEFSNYGIILKYIDSLDIIYIHTETKGQIAQRNIGLTYVLNIYEYVLFLDDDILLEPESIQSIIGFINNFPNATAVSMNITNGEKRAKSLYRSLFLFNNDIVGKVLESGYNTPITDVAKSSRTEWVCGGATLWRSDFLLANPQVPNEQEWAAGEDLSYSYPFHRLVEFYVCADALAYHNDIATNRNPIMVGFVETVFRGRFVIDNNLSMPKYCWMMFGLIFARMIIGVSRINRRDILISYGQIRGIIYIFKTIVFNSKLFR